MSQIVSSQNITEVCYLIQSLNQNMIVVIHDSIYNLHFFFRPGCRFVSWVGFRLIYSRFHTRTIQPTYFHEEEENKTSEISWISMSAAFKVNFTYRYKINMHRLGWFFRSKLLNKQINQGLRNMWNIKFLVNIVHIK